MGEAEKLPDVMEQAGVTVLDTVPTLLSMLPRDIATPARHHPRRRGLPARHRRALVRAGRRIFNSYGPTEATVVATIAEVRAGEPVTIGQPIPNYTCYVVERDAEPARPRTAKANC